MTLTFYLSTSKSSQFIFVFKCTEIANLVKFSKAVYGNIVHFTSFRDVGQDGRTTHMRSAQTFIWQRGKVTVLIVTGDSVRKYFQKLKTKR